MEIKESANQQGSRLINQPFEDVMTKRRKQDNGNAKTTEEATEPKSVRVPPELIEAIIPRIMKSPNGSTRFLSKHDISLSEAIRWALHDYIDLLKINGELKNEIKELKNIIAKIEKLETQMDIIKRKLQKS